MPSTDGRARRGTATSWRKSCRMEGNDQGPSLFSKEEDKAKPLLRFAKMNRSQQAGKARQLQTPLTENLTRGRLIKITREDLMQQATPKGSDYLGFGKHGATTYQEVLKVDHEYCLYRKLKRFSSWLKIQSVCQEPNLVNNMIQERGRQLKEEMLFAEMQASKELDKRRKTPEQKRSQLDNSFGGGKPFIEGTSSEVDGTSSVVDDVFAGAWGGELGRELCGMAESHGKNTMMSTMSSEEVRWMDEQVRCSTAGPAWDHLIEQTGLVLAEIGVTLKSKSVQHHGGLTGKGTAVQLGGTGSHMNDHAGRRPLAKSLEHDRPQPLVQSEMWSPLQNITGWGQPSDGKTETTEETPTAGMQKSS